jgi:hypothetical protein
MGSDDDREVLQAVRDNTGARCAWTPTKVDA